MRVVFLGTPAFAIPTLEALLQQPEYQVAGVLTQPDRPAGRGLELSPSPVKRLAREHGMPVLQPQRVSGNPQALEWLDELEPELAVVVAFGQLLPPDFFQRPPLGSLNVHASLLPRYRGAAPVAHALLQGEQQTGVTIMKIDEGLDSGDILSQSSTPVDDRITCGELEELLASQGARLLLETIPPYAAGSLRPRPQDHARATRAPRLGREDGRIRWDQGARTIHNLIRAMNPWPAARTRLRGQTLTVWSSSRADELRSPCGEAGRILEIAGDALRVECGQGTGLLLHELQLPGRRRMVARDLANGLKLRAGERFH